MIDLYSEIVEYIGDGKRVRTAPMIRSIAKKNRVSQKVIRKLFENESDSLIDKGLYLEFASEGVIWFTRLESRKHIPIIRGMRCPSIKKRD